MIPLQERTVSAGKFSVDRAVLIQEGFGVSEHTLRPCEGTDIIQVLKLPLSFTKRYLPFETDHKNRS